MVNNNLLKARMIEKGYNQNKLAEAMAVSKQSMSYRFNEKYDWTLSEIRQIKELLNLKPKDIIDIFFI